MAASITFKMDEREVLLDELKRQVTDQLVLASLEHIVEKVNHEIGDQRCPTHNEPPHVTISLSQSGQLKMQTTSCCDIFKNKATEPLQREFNKTAYFSPGGKLILLVEGGKTPFVFNIESITELEIGRTEAEGETAPAINLQPYNAVEKGVSRKHARIVWQRGALHFIDNDSRNGSFLNGEELTPQKPYILHDGDTLHLGQMGLNVMLAMRDSTAES